MATATAHGKNNEHGGRDRDHDGAVDGGGGGSAITLVINLDLRAAGAGRYVSRLNLTRGAVMSLFF